MRIVNRFLNTEQSYKNWTYLGQQVKRTVPNIKGAMLNMNDSEINKLLKQSNTMAAVWYGIRWLGRRLLLALHSDGP